MVECLDLCRNVFVCEKSKDFIHVWYVTCKNTEIVLTSTAVTRSTELLRNTRKDMVHSQQLQISEKFSLSVVSVARIIISCRQVALQSRHFITNVLTMLLRYFLPDSVY